MPAHKLTKQPDDGTHLICTRCKDKKPYRMFYCAQPGSGHFKTYGGYSMPCITCDNTNSRSRRATPEACAKRNAQRAANPELRAKDNAAKLEKYYANRERISAERKAHRASLSPVEREAALAKQRSAASSPEKRAAQLQYMRMWSNTEHGRAIVRVHGNRRKALTRGVDASLTPEQWLSALDAYGRKCIYCSVDCQVPTMDHVIPLAKGGAHSIDNVVPSCPHCNFSKGKTDVDLFLSRANLDRGSFLIKRLTGLAKLVC